MQILYQNIMLFYACFYKHGKTDIDYIFAPTGLCAIIRNGETFYVLNDNMGSVQIITDDNANIVNEWYYTPWGGRTRIDGNDMDSYPDLTDRGYTGHEHIFSHCMETGGVGGLGLINMNGRIYDPTLARFLSPDPYVQAPDFSQGFNRYSYCLNNPFKFTDPEGESWTVFLIGCLVYAAIEYGTQVYHNWQASKAMESQGYDPMSKKDMWFGEIDWFDVAFNGVMGGVTCVIPPAAAVAKWAVPLITYGTPIITNAFNWKGNGNFQTVFDGSIPIDQYLINTGIEVTSLYTTNVIKTGLATSTKDIYNPAKHTKYFSKEILGKEITMRSFEDMLQQTTASWIDYSIKATQYPAFNPDRLFYDGIPAFPEHHQNSNVGYPDIQPYNPPNPPIKPPHYESPSKSQRNKGRKDKSLEQYLQLYPVR